MTELARTEMPAATPQESGPPPPSLDAATLPPRGALFERSAVQEALNHRFGACGVRECPNQFVVVTPRSRRLCRSERFTTFLHTLGEQYPGYTFVAAQPNFKAFRAKPLHAKDLAPKEDVRSPELAHTMLRDLGGIDPRKVRYPDRFGYRPRRGEKRRSFESSDCFSIDHKAGTPDIDDVLHIRKTDRGYLLQIHIADVNHFVAEGTDVDLHARVRAESSYGGWSMIPMLPKGLACVAASLRQGQIRPTLTMSAELNQDYGVEGVTFEAGTIRSRGEYSMREVDHVLDSGASCPHGGQFKLLYEAAQAFAMRRAKSGGLVLDTPDRGDFIVREMMVFYGAQQAQELLRRKLPAPFRVNGAIGLEVVNRVRQRLESIGARDLPHVATLAELYHSVREQSAEVQHDHRLRRIFEGALASSSYSLTPAPHHALGLPCYVHATSPIRRYSDLLIQRVMAGCDYRPRLGELHLIVTQLNNARPLREQDSSCLGEIETVKARLTETPVEYEARVIGMSKEGVEIYCPGLRQVGILDVDFTLYGTSLAVLNLHERTASVQVGDTVGVCLSGYSRLKGRFLWYPFDR